MNKIVNIGLTALFACFVAACENDIDNYDAPNGGVYGTIYDKETNEPVPMPVPGSSGVMMSLYEQNTGATASVRAYEGVQWQLSYSGKGWSFCRGM